MRAARRLAAVPLSAAALLAGCDRSGSGNRSTPVITVDLHRDRQAVEVRGLPREYMRWLARLAPADSTWPRLVAVYVERDSGHVVSDATPPVIGRYVASRDLVRFEPRFPFTAGAAYRVEVDTAALAGGPANARPRDGRAMLAHRFVLPAITRARTTRITAVHPSSARLPGNLLRWYVETSAAMEAGHALEHVHLMDESGREVTGAFLTLDQELWDRDRRRLTLLVDPGRVKRGVRTNVEMGPPLVAGRRYRLVIDDEWTDGEGARLASGYEHAFEVVDADRRSPDPARWRLTPPGAGTRTAFRVAFGEPLDHALAARLLAVLDAGGSLIPGTVALADADRVWMFTPDRDWAPGQYTLRVGGALEDLAGNNIVRVFDVDRRADSAAADREVAGASRTVTFRIVANP
jgi:hypothetical protein